MSTQITTLDLDSFDRAVDSVAQQRYSRALPRRRARVQLQKLRTLIGAIAIAPVVVAVVSTLAFLLLTRLIIELVAAGLER